jgi:membrane-bound lytic murein transglycosylase B
VRSPRAAFILALALLAGPARAQDGDFSGFVASLRSDATARGISQKTFDAAFAGVQAPDSDVAPGPAPPAARARG